MTQNNTKNNNGEEKEAHTDKNLEEDDMTEDLMHVMEELADHPTLGIIRLDYDYPTAAGDIDNPSSFGYPVVYRVVPGLTFQVAQSGDLTPEVAKELDAAIRWLAEDQKVNAISGDCGFMLWFQERVRKITSIPVMLSPLQQLPTITTAFNMKTSKVVVLTANVKSLSPMRPLIEGMISGLCEEDMHYVYVGCEDVPHFGYEVEHGLKVDTEKAEPGILKKCEEALKMYPSAYAFLFECTELPPYSDAVRAKTGLPVFDAITGCDYVMTSFLDNARFGQDAWYKPWDGKQRSYYFGKHLTKSQRNRLVTKPVSDDDMHHIMDELHKTKLMEMVHGFSTTITMEQIAHAIVDQMEDAIVEENLEKIMHHAEEQGGDGTKKKRPPCQHAQEEVTSGRLRRLRRLRIRMRNALRRCDGGH